jgi:hypothetical protein
MVAHSSNLPVPVQDASPGAFFKAASAKAGERTLRRINAVGCLPSRLHHIERFAVRRVWASKQAEPVAINNADVVKPWAVIDFVRAIGCIRRNTHESSSLYWYGGSERWGYRKAGNGVMGTAIRLDRLDGVAAAKVRNMQSLFFRQAVLGFGVSKTGEGAARDEYFGESDSVALHFSSFPETLI